MKDTYSEFARYIIVGGAAFLVDAGIVYFSREYLLIDAFYGLYFAVGLGFIAGLLVNFGLSVIFVFKEGKKKIQGKRLVALSIFAVIGLLGLVLTEIGMFVGENFTSLHYMFVKIIVSGVVMVWNYAARKIFVFRGTA